MAEMYSERQYTLVQTTIAENLITRKKLPIDSPQAKKLTNCVAKFIVGDMQPLNMVESPLFLNLLEEMKVACHSLFTNVVLRDMFEDTKTMVRTQLEKAEGIALTTDSWTSRATDDYVMVTAHVIDSAFEMISFVLQTSPLGCSHTAQNLCESLADMESKWEILLRDPLPVYVSDNAWSIANALQLLGRQHTGCMAHTLNLAVKRGKGGPNSFGKVQVHCWTF